MHPTVEHLPKHIDVSLEKNHFYETLWKQVGLDLLGGHCASLNGLSLLDYGCGRGETLSLARDYGLKPIGTDVDPECVTLSCAHGPAVRLEHPNNPAYQFGDKSVDVVTCFHVLEHVDRPKEVLTSLAKIARRYVVVAVPNLRSLPKPSAMRRESKAVNEGHLQGWDHGHFRNLAEKHCGLRLIAWGHDHVKLPVVGCLISKIAGEDTLRRLEMGCWLRWFPFHSASLIALMEPISI